MWHLDLILLIFFILLIVTFIFRYYLFNKRGIKEKKVFVILILISLILVFSSYVIVIQSVENISSDHTNWDPPQFSANLAGNTNIHLSYRISVDGYSDTTVLYKLEIYNSNGDMVHSKSNSKFVDVNEHIGGGEWDDSTTFYCEKGGEYRLLFSFNGTDTGWDEPDITRVKISSVQEDYMMISLLLGISSLILLGVANLLNVNIYLKNKKEKKGSSTPPLI